MDDDLLADDGQYKDDGLEDLDIDEEAALLGLSDEEIDGRGNEELEYVDEDGNPVEIGENNAELYEVANIATDKRSSPPEDDVLDLDLDAEIESFTQENPDLTRESPIKTFNDRQHKENLISLTSRSEHDKSARRRDHSPERASERSEIDLSYLSHNLSSRHIASDSYNEPLEYDEESEDESIDDHRERFKSERSNIITLTPAKKRVDIPDTLESVISVEETAKVQAFLDNEQKRKMRLKGKSGGRMKNPQNFSRPPPSYPNQSQHQQHQQPPHQQPPHQQLPHQQPPHQQLPHQQPPHQQHPHQQPPHQQPPHQQPPHQQPLHTQAPHPSPHQQSQFSSAQSYQAPLTSSSQSRKILINPHFRGVRLPLPVTSDQGMTVNQPPQESIPPPGSYGTPQNYAPPMYPHHDNSLPVNVSQPVFSTPPPSIPYKPPEYPSPIPPPQTHMQQPPIWQSPPEIAQPPVSYANPPPVLNYGDPLAQVPGYHSNYNQNAYQNAGYQNVPIPPPQPINYSQPPPPVHLHTPSYNPPPVTSTHTTGHYQSSQPGPLQNVMQKPYHEQRNIGHNLPPHAQRKNLPQNPRFSRQNEKRPSNSNIKQVPMKVPRMEHQVRKNSHVNNSNIREIPLVDTMASSRKTNMKKSAPAVEDEDEKTKELRMKIEEQKLLREQILKRKEERRRQMASQRMTELKQRQAEQNSNVISIQRVDQMPQVKPTPAQNATKTSVKERIGIPMSKNITPAKKKVIVVRKKANQTATNPVSIQQKKVPIRQRVGLKPPLQQPNLHAQNKPVGNASANQAQTPNQTPGGTPVPPGKQKVVLKTSQVNKTPVVDNKVQKAFPKNNTNSNLKQNQNQKGKVQHRLGNRGNFQRLPMNQPRTPSHQGPPRMMMPPSPRFNGPRTPQFQNSPFMEQHRMRFPPQGPPMNDMRIPRPPFQDQRSPLLQFRPSGDQPPFMFEPNHPRFRMQGPGFQNFRPHMGMERFPDRFQSHPFPNQMPPMRSQMFEPNGAPFQRPRFQRGSNSRQRFNSSHQTNSSGSKNSPAKANNASASTASSAAPAENQTDSSAAKTPESKASAAANPQNSHKVQNISDNSAEPKSHSVSVENLSSSTSEAQLKKLCSSVGVVESIDHIKDQRKAVVTFKEHKQALGFHKKYQSYALFNTT